MQNHRSLHSITQELERTPEVVAASAYRAGAAGEIFSGRLSVPALEPGQTLGAVGAVLGGGRAVPGAVPGAQTIPETGYNERIAKSATPGAKTCGAWAVVAECSTGKHRFAKRLVCGKEWCPECGQDRSAAHDRRLARVLPKLQQIKRLGYFVIEFPDRYRRLPGWAYSKKGLRAATSRVVDVLAGRRCGRRGRVDGFFARGLLRWHWFGEKRPGKFNPHLNVLVNAGHLTPRLLERIKAELRAALRCPDLIVHYSYVERPAQIVHKGRYVTRSTFLDRTWDEYMAAELHKFRNIRWWGNWDGPAVWSLCQAKAEGADVAGLQAVAGLQSGVCPDCGAPLAVLRHNRAGQPVQWTRPLDSIWLVLWGAQEIEGTGYYCIPARAWAGSEFSPDELLRLERLEAAARDAPSVLPAARSARRYVERRLCIARDEALCGE